MAYLKQGLELPPLSNAPPLLQLWTTGGVIIVMLTSLIIVTILALQDNSRYSLGYLYIIVPFLIILVALCIVFMKDINAYRERKKE
jgi:hypothetical protein